MRKLQINNGYVLKDKVMKLFEETDRQFYFGRRRKNGGERKMREIKFRAWHKPTQLMDDVVLIDFYNEKIGILYADPVMQCESIQKYNFNEAELMQYTGLKDKNGEEIYEGDIVENTTQTVYLGDKYEVVWNKNYGGYQLMSNGFTSNIPLIQNFMSYKVIGNIYEQEG